MVGVCLLSDVELLVWPQTSRSANLGSVPEGTCITVKGCVSPMADDTPARLARQPTTHRGVQHSYVPGSTTEGLQIAWEHVKGA